jgi:hypothetical protein
MWTFPNTLFQIKYTPFLIGFGESQAKKNSESFSGVGKN